MDIEKAIKRLQANQKENKVIEVDIEQIKLLWCEIGKKYFPGYHFNENSEKICTALLSTPNKGLLLMGANGTGKTLNCLIYQQMCQLMNFKTAFNISVKAIEEKYKLRGTEFFSDIRTTPNLIIHDIGYETKDFGDFGSKRNLIEDLLFERYDLFQTTGMKTHATTNKNGEELKAFYGLRVYDRMREMFKPLIVDGESLRK